MTTRTGEEGEDLRYADPESEVPDAVRDFVIESGIGRVYRCHLIETVEGKPPGVLREYTNEYPDLNTVGREWGPGAYTWRFSYKQTGPDGKRSTTTKEYSHAFPERAWREAHNLYLEEIEEKRYKDRKDRLERRKREETLEAARNGGQVPAGDSGLKNLKEAITTAKELGIPIGGKGGGVTEMIPLITALAPIIAEMMKGKSGGGGEEMIAKMMMMQQERQAEFTKTLLTAATALLPILLPKGIQGENEHMKQMMNMAFGLVKQAADFKMALNPPEPTMLDKVLEKVSEFAPVLLEFAKQSREQREQSMMYKMAMNSQTAKEFKEAANDKGLLIEVVNRLDKAYGFEAANGILEVAGLVRPEETFGNAEKFKVQEEEKAQG